MASDNAGEEKQSAVSSDSEVVAQELELLDFSPDELREKYKSERDKRIRAAGNNQYISISGDLSTFKDDPNVEPGFERQPLADEVNVVVIGAGFGGILAGARMREAGIDGIRFIEAGNEFGGTWYWNRYPGAQCDIESYCYMPLLEELNYIPKEKYSYATELFDHCRRMADAYNLYQDVCFQTNVTDLKWDEHARLWVVSTDRGDLIKARFVIMATGPMSCPKLPGINGIGAFKGHMFHTSRWDYNYTGGDHTGNLVGLSDKRVGFIGTGATAVQCIPFVGKYAKELYVFQRTPSSVDLRGNKPTDPEWFKSLKPGWQAERRKNFNDVVTGKFVEEDLVSDGWTDLFGILREMVLRQSDGELSEGDASLLAELADFKKMNSLRGRVDETVDDPETAEKLKAWYRQYCKRPTFNDDYLPTFNRPNVFLIDTSDTAGVERITEEGIETGGKHYPLDCIIFSTGFEIGTSYVQRAGFDVTGINGLTLSEHWSKGPRTFHGFFSRGFPNAFIVGTTQKGLSVNFTSLLDDQAQHIAYVINEVCQRETCFQPTEEAESEWVQTIKDLAVENLDFFDACTPSYYNSEGHIREEGGGITKEVYGKGANAFNALIKVWRERGDLQGLEFF